MADPYGNAQAGGLGGAKAPEMDQSRALDWNSFTDDELFAMLGAPPPGMPIKTYLAYQLRTNPDAVHGRMNELARPRQGETPEAFKARLQDTFKNVPRLADRFYQTSGLQTQDEKDASTRQTQESQYRDQMKQTQNQYSSLYGQYQNAAAPYLDQNSPQARAQQQMVSQQVMNGVDREAMSRGLGGGGFSQNVQGQANTLAQNKLADSRAQMGANILGQGMNALSGLGNAIQQPYQTGLGAQQWDRNFSFQQDQAKRQEALQRAQMQANQTAGIFGGVGSVLSGVAGMIPGGQAASSMISGMSRGLGGAAGAAQLNSGYNPGYQGNR